MPLLILLFALLLYIYSEISLLITLGSAIGVLPLILLMIAISCAGLWLIRLRGIATILQIRQQISQGQMPTQAVTNSLFFAISGILLLIPGLLSDILAISLLIPLTRTLLQRIFLKLLGDKFRFVHIAPNFRTQNDQQTFEAEFERKQDEDRWLK